MTQILLAAFDRYEEAAQAKAELLAQGLDTADVQLSASMNPIALDSDAVEVIGEEPGADATPAEHLGAFFHRLFGDDAPRHAGRYPEAARRGSTLLTVSLADDSRVAGVEALLVRHGAIDLDERSASWGDGDATPVTASTETLTTGYPDATSISVDPGQLDGSTSPERGAQCGSIPGRTENLRAGHRDNHAGRVRIIPR